MSPDAKDLDPSRHARTGTEGQTLGAKTGNRDRLSRHETKKDRGPKTTACLYRSKPLAYYEFS